MKKKAQLAMLDKIERLSNAGLKQKDIATLLKLHGSQDEQRAGESCLTTIGRGQGFSLGLKSCLSESAYLCLSASENVGDFTQGLRDAIGALEVDEASGAALVKVFIKPLLGLSAALSVSAALAAFAFPMLAEQGPRQRWGMISSSAESFGLFWLHHGLTFIALLIIGIIIVTLSLSRYTGAARRWIDAWPVYRQYRYIQCTNLLTSVAHQILVGNSIKSALEHYDNHPSAYMNAHIRRMLSTISRGKTNVGVIFDSGLMDTAELDMLKMLSETGDAPTILKKSAEMHATQLLLEMNRLKAWGSRCLLLCIVLIGAWMALGAGTLAFDMATNLKL